MPFDPDWLQLPDRSPLRALRADVVLGAGGVPGCTELGDGFWATTSGHEGLPPDEAPVRAVVWACSVEGLRCLVESGDPPDDGAPPPPALGIPDARFGVLHGEAASPARALQRFDDGVGVALWFSSGGRKVYYGGVAPDDEALPIAVVMGLR